MFLDECRQDDTGLFNEEQLLYLCVDLFTAGSDTTANTIQVKVRAIGLVFKSKAKSGLIYM